MVLAPNAPALRLDDRFFGKFVEPAYFLGYVKYRDVFRATHVSCWCLKSRRVGEASGSGTRRALPAGTTTTRRFA